MVLVYSNSLARHFSFMFHAKCLLPRLDRLLPVRSCLQNFYQCTLAHYWEKMTQWTKQRNSLGTCVIYNSGICSVILLYAWPEAVVGILKVVCFYVNIPLSWLHMNYVLRKRLGHMGNSEFLITAFKESVANAFGVSICLKEPIFRGLRGDGCHIT